jgi:hemolysin activation/secretion protein
MAKDTIKLSLITALALGGTSVLYAEDAQQIEKRFQETPKAKSTAKPLFPKIQDKIPPKEAEKVKFVLKGINFGKSIYSKEELKLIYKDLLNKEISLLDLYKISNTITAKYGKDGYSLSKAYIPKQNINKDGIVTIGILEGYIDEVIFEDKFTDKRELLKKYAEEIKKSKPINTKVLEKYLGLMNDLGGITAKSSLKHSKKNRGASNLIIKIQETKVSGFVSIDNRGTESSGTRQGNAGVNISNPFGFLSSTDLMYATSEDVNELRYFSGSTKFTVNNSGTMVNISGSNSIAKSGTPTLQALNQRSSSKSFAIKVTQPIITSRQTNLSVSAKLDTKNSKSYQLGTKTSDDQLRVLRLGLDYDYVDGTNATNQVLLEYSHGLKGLGASSQDSSLKTRDDGVINFNKLTLTLTRTQPLPIVKGLSLKTMINAQYTADPLLSGEEFSIGGKEYGRAYDSSEITGDHGIAFSTELMYNIPYSSKYLKSIQAFTFYDIGQVYNLNSNATTPKIQSLASTGVGLRYRLIGDFSGSLTLTRPLTREVSNQGDKQPRIFFTLDYRFQGAK